MTRTARYAAAALAAFLAADGPRALPAEAAAPPVNAGAAGNPYGAWRRGPPSDPDFFPIAVWLQAPRNAERYRAAGINVYVGLWAGPTAEQLDALEKAGMLVICDQNQAGLARREGKTIVGWMHGDEPDNAQSLGEGKGWGPPVPPEKIVSDYRRLREADPDRPILLNLGQGVAWDGWYGRGVRTNHPEDYAEYVRGGDIISFDIYPAVHDRAEVAGKLWYVPRGVDRLREWTEDRRVVWNCIECTRIGNPKVKPTPWQVRAEVWMSLIHGSMGLIYFVHQFAPSFVEAGLLADEEMLLAVTAINREIRALAPVLNGPSVKDAARVRSSDEKAPIDVMVKRHDGATYIFAVSMRDAPATATFEVKGLGDKARAEAIGGDARIEVEGGKFEDAFRGHEVKLYRIR